MNKILEIRNLRKSFSGNVVLDGIDFECEKGEIHALVGENGAGKSTLMKCVTGVHGVDCGEMVFDGSPLAPADTLDANTRGISMIFQEFNLITYLSVAENIFLGRQPVKHGFVIDRKKMDEKVRELSRQLNLEIAPNAVVADLSVAQQQMVEIMKALSFEAKLIIMDEPTAALNPYEVRFLFNIMISLKEQGKTVIFITHRLNEVFEIADRVTTLKDGQIVRTVRKNDVTKREIVSMMVGREMENIFPEIVSYADPDTDAMLRVRQFVVKEGRPPVEFDVRAGEIVSLAGLEGQGQTEIIRSLFGLRRVREEHKGGITLDNKPYHVGTTKNAAKSGISFLSDDRKEECLCLGASIARNICLPIVGRIAKGRVVLTNGIERQNAKELSERLKVKTTSLDKEVQYLSGGNQQKVALAKCLITKPKLLIVHEPTRGIDISAKLEIYILLRELVRQGTAILMVSTDLFEVINISDRILVVFGHTIATELNPKDATEELIISYATGIEGT